MLKYGMLRFVFFTFLAIAIFFPVINIYWAYPSFTDLLVQNTEDEAIRVGQHLKKQAFDEHGNVRDLELLEQEVMELVEDFKLMKLKAFAPDGEIIYSTDAKDIGVVNTKDYFHNIVAKGSPFTKLVKKDTQSLENQVVTMDVVETYVPIMDGDKFKGAFELYYNITARNDKLGGSLSKASTVSLSMMGIFLGTIVFSLIKAGRSIEAREEAEKEVQESKRRLQDVIDGIPEPILTVDNDYKITMANRKVWELNEGVNPVAASRYCYEVLHNRQESCKGKSGHCPLRKVTDTKLPVTVEHADTDKDGNKTYVEILAAPIFDSEGGVAQVIESYHDITERKHFIEQLENAHKELIEVSRRAGMAEVATGVLHNVGNVLNSINVSATLINERVMNSEAGNLEKVAELLQEHHDDIGNFLTQDEQGKQIMVYLSEVSRQLNEDHLVIIDKLQTLTKNIDHIKHTVKMQQQYAKSSSVEIESSLGEIIDDAIQINLTSMERHQITLDRNIEDIGLTKIEKHKILQILVNLISNAKGALKAVDREDKKIRVCFYKDGDRLKIEISDNGIGISEENLTKIFRHGFTTRDEGHGFGLHSGWLAAKEMKGSLTATSQGPGKGATFTLELPYKPVEESVCG